MIGQFFLLTHDVHTRFDDAEDWSSQHFGRKLWREQVETKVDHLDDENAKTAKWSMALWTTPRRATIGAAPALQVHDIILSISKILLLFIAN